MADNIAVTPGTGKTVATDEVVDGTLGTVQVQFVKLMDGTLDSTNKLFISAAGAAKVDGSAVTQPVSGTFFQATQPVSIASMPSTPVTGPLTDTQLRATAVPVSGTFFQATQPISGTIAATQSGTWNITNISGTVSLPTGAATAAKQPALGTAGTASSDVITVQGVASMTALKVDGSAATQPVSGTVTANAGTGTFNINSNASVNVNLIGGTATSVNNGVTDAGTQRVTISNDSTGQIAIRPSNLTVTATGAAAAAVTLTLPAVAGQFHYITGIEIEAYSTAARTGGVTPVLVTSTNLPGSNAWTFSSAAVIGSTDTKWYQWSGGVKSSVVNTATTIVCPATTSIIWRINVFYYTGV